MILIRRKERRQGTSAVEMALIAPIFIALIMGQIESSRLGMVAQVLNNAAREGCRMAVIPGNTQLQVQQRVNDVLVGAGIPIVTVTPSPSDWSTVVMGTPITVRFSVPFSQVSWFATPYYLKTATVTASATMHKE